MNEKFEESFVAVKKGVEMLERLVAEEPNPDPQAFSPMYPVYEHLQKAYLMLDAKLAGYFQGAGVDKRFKDNYDLLKDPKFALDENALPAWDEKVLSMYTTVESARNLLDMHSSLSELLSKYIKRRVSAAELARKDMRLSDMRQLQMPLGLGFTYNNKPWSFNMLLMGNQANPDLPIMPIPQVKYAVWSKLDALAKDGFPDGFKSAYELKKSELEASQASRAVMHGTIDIDSLRYAKSEEEVIVKDGMNARTGKPYSKDDTQPFHIATIDNDF